MTAKKSRRAIPSTAAPTTPDPALAAIEEYQRRNAEWFRLCMECDEAESSRHFQPPGREITLAALSARIDCARSALDAATKRVIATKPTTTAGAAALIHFIIDDMKINGDDASEWPVRLLFTAAAALDGMAA